MFPIWRDSRQASGLRQKMEKKGRDNIRRVGIKNTALLCGAEEKTQFLLALSVCLTCCKTLCSGSFCSVEEGEGMCLCIFIDHKYLFCAGLRYSHLNILRVLLRLTWHLFSHTEDLCACKFCSKSQHSLALSLVTSRQERFEFHLGVQKGRCSELISHMCSGHCPFWLFCSLCPH